MKILGFKNRNNWIATGLVVFSVLSIYLNGSSLLAIYRYYQQIFGPVLWVFILLSAVLLTNVGQIITRCHKDEPSLAGLKFVESAGPAAGLLGTVLSLMNGFGHLNLSGDNLDAAINGIIHTISISLSTTAFGLILSLLAWTLRSCLLAMLAAREKSEQVLAEVVATTKEASELVAVEECDA